MPNALVRAKCDATGAIAALPEGALELGHIKGWRRVDGPVPDRPKPALRRRPKETPAPDEPTDSQE